MYSEMTSIYLLICPVTGEVRYVGQSVDPERRLSQHYWAGWSHNSEMNLWMRLLKNRKKKPIMRIVEHVPRKLAYFLEKQWIEYGNDLGWPLLNKQILHTRAYDYRYEMVQKLRNEILDK